MGKEKTYLLKTDLFETFGSGNQVYFTLCSRLSGM